MRIDGIATGTRNRILIASLLLLAAAVYGQTAGFPFIDMDDDAYVTANPVVRAGLTWDGIRWSFTAVHASNWHPLTWISHMLDVELFGLDAGRHHLVNLLFHALNSALLFLLLEKTTRAPWRSALAAALFAIHPLHVESVAWVSERKDLLSAFFFLLALRAYAGYAASGGVRRYLAVALFFALGLLSKPMVVTFPFVLLLLDYWPLGRATAAGGEGTGRVLSRLVAEKAPLFLMAAASCVATLVAQERGGAIVSTEAIPVEGRIATAAWAYGAYLWKTVWPFRLAAFYPHPWKTPGGLQAWQAALSALAIVAVTAHSIRRGKDRPWLPVGWFWFLGMLVPVIGLVQVGGQSMADRYAYLPLVGLFVAGVWGAAAFLEGRDPGCRRRAILAGALLAALLPAAWVQAGHWRSSASLFAHAIEVTENNWFAHNNLGTALDREGRFEEALDHFREATRIRPDYVLARVNADRMRYNLATSRAQEGRLDEAIVLFRELLDGSPGNASLHNNLGIALYLRGDAAEAAAHFTEALRLNPGDAGARANLEKAMGAR